MPRTRDGFVPLGDVSQAVALPGDRALTHRADASPARRPFTRLDQVTQLVQASEADPEVGFWKTRRPSMSATQAHHACAERPQEPRPGCGWAPHGPGPRCDLLGASSRRYARQQRPCPQWQGKGFEPDAELMNH